MLVPIGNRILIKPVETVLGTIIVHNQKPIRFHVVSIGDDVTKVKPGDIIFLEKYYGAELDYEKEKYLVIDEKSILAKIA
jgi:chaperonin GroES